MLLGGCTIVTQELTLEEQRSMITLDRSKMFATDAPITGPITLEEALQRALAYNLDSRMMEMEQALRNNQLNLSRYDLLPQLALNSGYINRNKKNLSLSRDESTGLLTTNPFLSQDPELTNGSLGLTWNVLDFGVSYLQARQNADQLLIAKERRRRVVNQIVQGVRSAYWRAATAEPLYRQIVPILVDARAALADARQAEAQRLSPLIESLQYQKELVEVIRELDVLELDLAVAKSEIASLMGLSPGTTFELSLPPPEQMTVPKLPMTLEQMEETALENRPELREERYQQRISAQDTRKALLGMFPSLNLAATGYTDSNSFLVYQNWADSALRLSWDLINIARYPAVRKTAKSAEELAEARRLALSMATLTQVHVGYHQYNRATRDYDQALVLDDIEKRIFNNINEGANNQGQSPLQRIRAQLAAIYAEVNRYIAYSELHSALANLYVSMGLDLTPELLPSGSETGIADAAATTVSATAPPVAAAVVAPANAAAAAVAAVVAQAAAADNTQVVAAAAAPAAAAPAADTATLARSFVQDWFAAWQARDVAGYLAHYDGGFMPDNNQDIDAWRQTRERNITRHDTIVIELETFDLVAESADEVTVELLMHFTAPTYEDRTSKRLLLRREGDMLGILEEHNLNVEVLGQ